MTTVQRGFLKKILDAAVENEFIDLDDVFDIGSEFGDDVDGAIKEVMGRVHNDRATNVPGHDRVVGVFNDYLYHKYHRGA